MMMTMTYLEGQMHGATLRLGVCFSLMAVVAVGGANEAHAAPFQVGRAAFEQIYNPTPWRASLDWMARLSDEPGEDFADHAGIEPQSPWPAHGWTARRFGSWRLARLEELVSHRTGHTTGVEEPRLVRLRPSPRFSSRRLRHVDAVVFGASSRDRPISDVYDFARVDSGKPTPITPVEAKRIRNPEPPAGKSKRPGRSADVLDVGIRTLDYIVLTTKYFVENISRILKNIL